MTNNKVAKKWLLEAARIARAAASAPAVLVVLDRLGSGMLAVIGKPEIVRVMADVASADLARLAGAGFAYVLLSGLATWLELRAERLDEPADKPLIVLPGDVKQDDKRSRPGGDSS